MNLNEIKLPERSNELVELEARHRKLQGQRVEAEAKLRGIETHLARQALGDETETDRLAEQLASGEIDRISLKNLPAQQAQLRAELDLIQRGSTKLWPVLARQRERYNNQIIRAFRPKHKAAALAILRALEELVEANAAEEAVRSACPIGLINVGFPGIGDWSANGARSARLWRQHVERLGFFEPEPKAEPAPKPRRGLFASKANGAAESAPAMAAKGSD
jgi:hypothetical protein